MKCDTAEINEILIQFSMYRKEYFERNICVEYCVVWPQIIEKLQALQTRISSKTEK